MGTRILEGVRINECDRPGAVFYDSCEGRAFGPVFDSGEEASNFLLFLAGTDPRLLGWSATSTGNELYKLWLQSGRSAHRPVFQFDESFLLKTTTKHEACLDCDDLIDMHREGKPHCDCGESWQNGKCPADTGFQEFEIACSFVEHCFPLFNGLNNNDVAKILMKAKILGKEVLGEAEADPEHSCLYIHFKNREQAGQFLWRMNAWLRENWHRAYPHGTREKKPAKRKPKKTKSP